VVLPSSHSDHTLLPEAFDEFRTALFPLVAMPQLAAVASSPRKQIPVGGHTSGMLLPARNGGDMPVLEQRGDQLWIINLFITISQSQLPVGTPPPGVQRHEKFDDPIIHPKYAPKG